MTWFRKLESTLRCKEGGGGVNNNMVVEIDMALTNVQNKIEFYASSKSTFVKIHSEKHTSELLYDLSIGFKKIWTKDLFKSTDAFERFIFFVLFVQS